MNRVLPDTALKLRLAGFPQGITKYVWHRTRPMKVAFAGKDLGQRDWILYKRSKSDISAFGDVKGYSRWVSAPTIDEVQQWKNIVEKTEKLKVESAMMLIRMVEQILGIGGVDGCEKEED